MENKYYYKCDRKLINQVMEITDVDYEVWKEFIPIDSLEIALRDLLVEYHKKEEEFEEFIEDRNENWKQIEYKDQI